jgi:small subunit ribosomal protein S7
MIKLFNKWETENITVIDKGLQGYINLRPVIVPLTFGRNAKQQFYKSRYTIVERLILKLMVPGHKGKKHKLTSRHCTGKFMKKYKIVEKVFSMIEAKLKKNPVEVFVKSIENSTPREEINTIEYGGAKYPQPVECSPQRRIDIALRQMVQGAYSKSFNTRRKFEDCLMDEIVYAYNNDQKSTAITKKVELERQADASR